MKFIKSLPLVTVMSAAALIAPVVVAQQHNHDHGQKAAETTPAKAEASLTEGEVRKIDKDNDALTIKHGFIKNLDMPGMTMVFKAKDKALLDKLQVGDKILFKAVNENGKFVVTEIQSNK